MVCLLAIRSNCIVVGARVFSRVCSFSFSINLYFLALLFFLSIISQHFGLTALGSVPPLFSLSFFHSLPLPVGIIYLFIFSCIFFSTYSDDIDIYFSLYVNNPCDGGIALIVNREMVRAFEPQNKEKYYIYMNSHSDRTSTMYCRIKEKSGPSHLSISRVH